MTKTMMLAVTCALCLLVAQVNHVCSSEPNSEMVAAIASGHTARVAEFLTSGVDPNSHVQGGITFLMGAAYKGNGEVATLLLERGAKANARSDKGITALMLAAYNNHGAVVKLLLGYGSDANMRDDLGNTAFQMAAAQGHADVADMLKVHTKATDNWRIRTVVAPLGEEEECLGVMKDPEQDSQKVGCVQAGREVQIGGASNDDKWIMVRKPVSGWVPADKLKKTVTAQAQTKPVRPAAPQPTEESSYSRDTGAGSGTLDSSGSGPSDGAWWRRGQ